MKVNWMIAFSVVAFAAVSLFAQKSETFDIISFTSPKGWQKEASQNAVQMGVEDANGGLCLITMFKQVPGSNISKVNFDASWENIVEEMVTVKSAPDMQPSTNENGWTAENGFAPYESDGKTGVVLLVTITGDSKMINILILTNTDAYQTEISEFLDSVKLPKVANRSKTTEQIKPPAAISDGYAFTTTNWDDGWTSVVQDDWVLVTKGQMKVYLLYALPFNVNQATGNGVRARDYYFDNYVTKYFNIQTKQYRDNGENLSPLQPDYVEGWAIDRQTGEKRFVAMYLDNSPNAAWLNIASAPNEDLLRQQFPNSNKPNGSDLLAMSRFNQFAVSASDIVGKWEDGNMATAHWYYVSPAGNSSYAGMTIASTSSMFNFAAGGVYTSEHKGTTGSVGNLNSYKQNYKGTYKVAEWSITATNRWQGATETFKAWFQIIRGGRILILQQGGSKFNLVRVK